MKFKKKYGKMYVNFIIFFSEINFKCKNWWLNSVCDESKYKMREIRDKKCNSIYNLFCINML